MVAGNGNLQRLSANNHHHYPGLLRLSHDKSEYDFGFVTVKL